MKMDVIIIVMIASTMLNSSCEKSELTFDEGDLLIEIQAGEYWLHDFPLFLGLKKKNPPQFAVWIEDTEGNYVETIFATYKIAAQGWVANKGNRRKEALPYWCHKRGVVYDDGLLLPTKENPLVDAITGATPDGDNSLKMSLTDFSEPIVVKAEFNHSIDFNEYFPPDARVNDFNYSGGEEGSGQPAVVYSATIDPSDQRAEMHLEGYSSPDGSDGRLYTDLGPLTTAKNIVEKILIGKL